MRPETSRPKIALLCKLTSTVRFSTKSCDPHRSLVSAQKGHDSVHISGVLASRYHRRQAILPHDRSVRMLLAATAHPSCTHEPGPEVVRECLLSASCSG